MKLRAPARTQRARVQALFQKVADHFPGAAVLEEWYHDGSARIRLSTVEFTAGARVSFVEADVDGERMALVKVQDEHATVCVSPVPSAVIAVIRRI